tara:strand:+ start:93 stop:353 length:261 start_codon:yes stop_codon:yes gene_type:complete
MIDLATGIGVLAFLIPANSLIIDFAKKKPELANTVLAISMFTNVFIVLTYGAILKCYSTNDRLFISGILIAVFISMITKLKRLINE